MWQQTGFCRLQLVPVCLCSAHPALHRSLSRAVSGDRRDKLRLSIVPLLAADGTNLRSQACILLCPSSMWISCSLYEYLSLYLSYIDKSLEQR